MARFSFRLQPLLNVKSQQEDNKKIELGKAMQRLEAERARLKSLETEKSDYIDEFNKKAVKTTVLKLVEYNRYISLLTSKIKRQKENVNCASRNVDKIRGELIKVSSERKIFDKLKDSKYELFLKEQASEEQKLNDEIVSFRKGNDTGEKDAEFQQRR